MVITLLVLTRLPIRTTSAPVVELLIVASEYEEFFLIATRAGIFSTFWLLISFVDVRFSFGLPTDL